MLPSFKEKMAFINTLKRRWKEQKGYCSIFDKARNLKSRAIKAENIHQNRAAEFKQKRTFSAGELGRRK